MARGGRRQVTSVLGQGRYIPGQPWDPLGGRRRPPGRPYGPAQAPTTLASVGRLRAVVGLTVNKLTTC